MKALITGASSGIGRDMARYLSSKENELILVSSNKDKLESVSKALINSSVYVCDLSNNDNVINTIYYFESKICIRYNIFQNKHIIYFN